MIRTLDCPGNGLVAVSTHNFCECTACGVSCDDHIVLAVKRHIEETAKKLTCFPFAFFKWLINCTFQYFCLNFAPSFSYAQFTIVFMKIFFVIPNVSSCHYLHCSHPLQGLSVMWYLVIYLFVYDILYMIPTGLLICDKWHSQIHYNPVFCFSLVSQTIKICCGSVMIHGRWIKYRKIYRRAP